MSLQVQNVDFSYGRRPLFQNFSILFEPGINVLIGSNGSGKTTLMKLLAGIYPPKDGVLSLDGKKYGDYSDIRRHLSYLPQEFTAYQEMKVVDFLKFIAEIKFQKKAKDLQAQIDEAVEMTDVGEFLDKKIKALSGGMKKRVGIAQAVVSDARVIIADEPTASLDPEQCESFNHILRKISQDRIIITSTHIIQDIHADCGRIFILSEGELKFQGAFDVLQTTLKNNIFKIPRQDFSQLDQDAVKMIGEFEENGTQYIKFAPKREEDRSDQWEPCSYTSADIWRYYKS